MMAVDLEIEHNPFSPIKRKSPDNCPPSSKSSSEDDEKSFPTGLKIAKPRVETFDAESDEEIVFMDLYGGPVSSVEQEIGSWEDSLGNYGIVLTEDEKTRLKQFMRDQELTEIRVINSGANGVILSTLKGNQKMILKIAKNPCSANREKGAALFSSVNHPAFIEIAAQFAYDGKIRAQVMPEIEGDDLRSLMQKRRLSANALVKIAKQAAEGLVYLKGQEILHRDIQPRNILWDGNQAKIIDYDLAAKDNGAIYGAVGVEQYQAPEMNFPEKSIEIRTTENTVRSVAVYSCPVDAYALGKTLETCAKGVDWSQAPDREAAFRETLRGLVDMDSKTRMPIEQAYAMFATLDSEVLA